MVSCPNCILTVDLGYCCIERASGEDEPNESITDLYREDFLAAATIAYHFLRIRHQIPQ